MHLKKIRNLVIGGIENKIFNLILITVLVLTGAFVLVSANRSATLTSLTAETSVRQQESTSAIISETMSQVTRTSMERSNCMEARIVDEMFQDIRGRVALVADYASKIYANPGSYPAKPWRDPDASLNGLLVSQMIWADGVDREDPAIAAQAGLISNLSDMMISLCDATGSDNIFMGTQEGLFLSINYSSADWFGADGKVISYDARTRFWYQQAVEAGGLVFSDLEVDATTGEMSVVCAMPVYSPDGELRAVVGSDLFLHAMEAVMREFITDGGYSWIVNTDGHVIYSPNPEVIRISESASAADLRQSENAEMAALVRDAMAGETDVRLVTVRDEVFYMQGIPIPTVGWALFSAFPKETVDQVEAALLDNYSEITNEARVAYRDKIEKTSHSTVILLALLAAAAAAGALVLGKRIVRPLNTITRRISELREGDLEFQMDDAYRTGDEIEVLAESFADISHKTVLYVDRVREVTAEKERIGTELSMATRIQESMLPHVFPAYPDRREFDLFAAMDPAREVGGDFYDFFLIDDDHLCLVMADVSGKGVPGALFMMISKVILQSCAMLGKSAAEILEKTNEALCRNDEVQMFVTVWLGILEISTGKLTAANAGHEYPVLCRKEDNRFTLYKDKHGFVIGGMEGTKYRQYELQLHRGDKLFVYTDGVPEATDSREQLFGIDRMLDALNTDPSASPQQVLRNVRAAVDGFVGSAEQFDDLTMLCLEYKGVPDA